MSFKEFLEYLEKNLSSYDTFIIKATDCQNEKNKKRTPKKRFDDKKLNRAVNKMWEDAMMVAYTNVKSAVGNPKFDVYESWMKKIEEHELLDGLNDSISDLEFE